jgi:hypothetical protein
MAEQCLLLPLEGDIKRCGQHVRFGSLADICSAKGHVRFTPNSDRESGLLQKVMSALTPKADMCSAVADVCYGTKADSCTAAKCITRPPRRRWRARPQEW